MNVHVACYVLQTLLVDPADLNAELFEYIQTKPDYNQGKMYLVLANATFIGSVHVQLVPICEGKYLKPGDRIIINVSK